MENGLLGFPPGTREFSRYPNGYIFDYLTQPTTLEVTATSQGSPNVAITGNPISLDGGTQIKISFFCAGGNAGTGQNLWVDIQEDGVVIGEATVHSPTTAPVLAPIKMEVIKTPVAAVHTYRVTAYSSGGSGELRSVISNNYAPMWYSVEKWQNPS